MKWLVIIGLLLLATEAFSDRVARQPFQPPASSVLTINNSSAHDIGDAVYLHRHCQ